MTLRRTSLTIVLVLWSSPLTRADSKDEPVSFNRDIRPILSDVCFQCHGPDAKERKADLRLDNDEQLFAERDGYRILVPGDPAKSDLFRRLISTDADEQMPPPKSGKKISAAQIATIRRWIAQGAKYQGHWAFIPPARPGSPEIRNPKFEIRNLIDRFVMARLEREGLQLSPQANKATLLRRATLDLTGLPPSIDEIDEFLADESPAAFERVIDRLLASPRFGERFARPWLDAARYADTSGYQSDGDRSMWCCATGSLRRSTTTNRSTTSRSSNSRAICCRTRQWTKSSRPVSTVIIAATPKVGSSRRSTPSSTSSIGWTPPRRCGSA